MKHNIFRGGRLLAKLLGAVWVVSWLGYAVYGEPGASMSYVIGWPDEPPLKVEGCGREDATKDVVVKIGSGQSIGVTLCFKSQITNDGRWLVPYSGGTLATAQEVIGWTAANSEKLGSAEFEQLVRKYLEARMMSRGFESSTTRLGIEIIAMKWEPLYAAYLEAQKQGNAPLAKKFADELAALTGIRFSSNEHHSIEFARYVDAVGEWFTLPPGDVEDAKRQFWSARQELWKDAALFLFGGLLAGWALVACIGLIARGFMGVPRGQDSRRRRHRAKAKPASAEALMSGSRTTIDPETDSSP
jgi:hypothetical protein